MAVLKDTHGRHIHKLRLSLLDACNFRCVYCMPQKPKFMPTELLLKRKEIGRICNILVALGIDEIRLTGGEPCLRSDFLEIARDLSSLGLKKLAVTSNGLHMKKNLPELTSTACHHINFSLDSLNKKGFKFMAKVDGLQEVLESIFMAQELGFKVKINTVLMKGLNDSEVEDFIEFSTQYGIEVRFLELMRIGVARDNFDRHFIAASEVIDNIKKKWQLSPVKLPRDSTSFNYLLDNGAEIGFIASESRPFCGGCSRLRLSADGILRPCLMIDSGFSLKDKSKDEIESLLFATLPLKPTDRIYEVSQSMNQIGG